MRQPIAIATTFALISLSAQEPVTLTGKNFHKKVGHKKAAFVKFLAPWCGHCKKMKPDWDELGDKYENSKTVLIGDVDCTVEASKALCEEQGVKGYPTLMVYPPGETTGESYEGGRDLEALKKFAKTLGPSCSPKHLKKCSEEQKATLEGYMAMSAEALGAQMGEMEGRLSEASATHDALLKELQARFEESDKALKALKEELEPSLKLMKAVRRDTAPVEPAPKEEV